MKAQPTAARVRELFDYDADTGELRWKVRTSKRIRVGDVAGSRHGAGYVQVNVDGNNYLAHRVIWLFVHGEWPQEDIDHINGSRTDNRIVNLRDVSRMVNMENLRAPTSRNTSGYLGVSWSQKDGRWVSHITHAGRVQHIGAFLSKEDAYEAYLRTKRMVHVGCTI